jgi:O-antigen ligase
MPGLAIAGNINLARLADIADGLLIAVAVSLPWSTSVTSILTVLWLLSLIPTLEWSDVRNELATPAGGLPVLLCLLGALGMLWADGSLIERWKGFDSFLKFLVVPLLLVQFRRSDRGMWALAGYGLACVLLLALSSMFYFWPSTTFLHTLDRAVPVKNAATQSGEFVTCMFGFLYVMIESFERRRWLWSFALLAIVLAMLANATFIAIGRTALAIIPILVVILAAKTLKARGMAVLFASVIMVGSLAWYSSPHLRNRTLRIWTDIQKYEKTDDKNASGERIEFTKKSIGFIRESPIIGHGTGSIAPLFAMSAVGQTGAASSATTNPHNQTFAVAIQLGLIGAGVLWAMWIAHLLLFRGHGLAEWIGLVVVVQNIVGSLFNSHLFDFLQGWVYVLGVGVAGGMALKNRTIKERAGAKP